MSDIPAKLQKALGFWARSASESGWLKPDAAKSIEDADVATPSSLFDQAERPLVIALFGGTGVGKSTLLNRLAQSPIARASAERPTSRDITVYVHESVTVSRLPEEFPMAQMKTSIHQRSEWRNVMWVDMPDFDSVETSNRALVEMWLPHVDVLLYVVSPERYRDDEGWRLLLEHGKRHAWLFVMNHWDRGEQQQIEDFQALLVRAGLPDPMLFRTDSSPKSSSESSSESSPPPMRSAGDALEDSETGDSLVKPSGTGPSGVGLESSGDDFPALENSIRELAENQYIHQLEQRGVLQRLDELRTQGEALKQKLGHPDRLAKLPEQWQHFWRSESQQLDASLGWKIPTLSISHARSQPSLLSRWLPARPRLSKAMNTTPSQLISQSVGKTISHSVGSSVSNAVSSSANNIADTVLTADQASQPPTSSDASELSDQDNDQAGSEHKPGEGYQLMDASALTRIESSIERFLQEAVAAGTLPMKIAQEHLKTLMSQLRSDLPERVQDHLNQSLAAPGTPLQRATVKALGWLMAFLPLAALCWIGYRIVNGFVLGGSEPSQYLGSNFAINSIMLLALVWGVPALLRYHLLPSIERAAKRGLQSGMEHSLDEVQHRVATQLATVETEQQAVIAAYEALWSSDGPQTIDDALPDRLRRMLLNAEPSKGVLASTQS